MSKTLDEIKEEVSKEFGFRSWYVLGQKTEFFRQDVNESTNEEVRGIVDEIAERYAKEKVNEAIDKAAKIAFNTEPTNIIQDFGDACNFIGKSILKLKQ